MDLQKFLTLQDIARLIDRAPSTIKNDLRRAPHKVPPPIRIAGQRSLRWHSKVVEEWFEARAAQSRTASSKNF